ncbi:MAG: hypothetical protein EOP49_05330 [Sphingobacteriales bacterium]|nr:MAG: hypothetical protein EOP49_05330 [Sphingobacteriales bacterium]
MEEEVIESLNSEMQLGLERSSPATLILAKIEEYLSALLQGNPEVFFQTMYRWDIPESALAAAITQGGDQLAALAQIVYQRHLKRIRSRQEWKGFANPEEDELAW